MGQRDGGSGLRRREFDEASRRYVEGRPNDSFLLSDRFLSIKCN